MGRVVRSVGLLIESTGPRASVGSVCEIACSSGPPLAVEVVGFQGAMLLTVPLGDTSGIRPGDRVIARGTSASVAVGRLGRVVDASSRSTALASCRIAIRSAPRRQSADREAARSRSAPASAPSTPC
jgi:flagellar biosynthesis/type III secretory pathway ATPase